MNNERDLAGEATKREAYLRRLRADISPEEAAEELADSDCYDSDYLPDDFPDDDEF